MLAPQNFLLNWFEFSRATEGRRFYVLILGGLLFFCLLGVFEFLFDLLLEFFNIQHQVMLEVLVRVSRALLVPRLNCVLFSRPNALVERIPATHIKL